MPTFSAIPQRLVILSLAFLATVPSPGAGDVFTSTQKIMEMAASEGSALGTLSNYIVSEYDKLRTLSEFLWDRSKELHQKWKEDPRHLAHHPNGAFLLIQFFSQQWTALVNARPGLRDMLGSAASSLPTEEDYKGAIASLIRLQYVYQLSVDQMYAGNYFGHEGPALQPADAFLLGKQAFIDGYLHESTQWLQLSTRLLEEKGGSLPPTSGVSGNQASPFVNLAQSASLLGRCHVYMHDLKKAQEMYNLANALDPKAGDVVQLRKELDGEPVNYKRAGHSWDHNMTVLCLRPKHQSVAKILPIHVCRYKRVLGHTYLRYKEEILSVAPYASVFHDIIQDDEIDAVKQHIKGKMYRGQVGQGTTARTDNIRTSDLGWINDKDLSTVARLSQRVKLTTGLEVDQRLPDGPSSGEAMQVVNYGLGGHYGAHTDPSNHPPTGDKLFDSSGYRLATFLMYLSDVEIGGNTVFLRAGISVAPRKGMALFWFNLTPDMDEIDMLTEHAGCPVMVGEKWIANKWIRIYGNTFIRPCGLHANSTHLQVEQLMTPRCH